MSNLVDDLEKAYGVELPESYRMFITSGDHKKHPKIELTGYISGPYNLDFTDELLTDIVELGTNAGIYDMDDVPWEDDFAGWVPIASFSHPEVPEPKMFLALHADSERVSIFHYDGWTLCAVNPSFDAFVKGLPKAEATIGGDDDDDDGDDD